MNELDNEAWPPEKAPPQVDGSTVDDESALAFEIAAMRVRASWDELEAPEAPAAGPVAAAAADPFAPIVLAGDPFAPLPAAPAAAPVAPASAASPNAAADTAPMVFLQVTPAARSRGFDEPAPAPSFLPKKRLNNAAIAAIVGAVAVVGAIWLFSGGAPKEAAQEPTPTDPSALNASGRVEVPTPAPGADARLATQAGATRPTSATEAERPLAAAPSVRPSIEPIVKPLAASSFDAKRNNKRSSASAAQARPQRHESVASARPPKRKTGESARPAAPARDDAAKRKGTGFVSANPY